MYQALLDRDTNFEGVFYVGVKTTGIFCRPTCPARKPKPENVEYFASSREAMSGGYQPCLRCRPLSTNPATPATVQRLLEAVQQSPTGKLSDSELRDFGIDPSTARRQFQRQFGMTFHEYSRARRMGRALSDVRKGDSVISAQLNTGYESASGFWQAFRRTFGVPATGVAGIDSLHVRSIPTPLGSMLAVANQDGLHLLEFGDRRELEQELSAVRAQARSPVVPGDNPYLDLLGKELEDYFNGLATGFTVPLVMNGSPFQRDVWTTLRTIPPGLTWSYAQVAEKVGRPSAVRAVSRANGSNRLAIVVPCHRVIRSDGALCGYAGGVWRKKWLLEHERRLVAGTIEGPKQ
jgi:AraC family transcriptional regulator of adaptative response/methylated-DNA-[protein]-cysteine methyltransferase